MNADLRQKQHMVGFVTIEQREITSPEAHPSSPNQTVQLFALVAEDGLIEFRTREFSECMESGMKPFEGGDDHVLAIEANITMGFNGGQSRLPVVGIGFLTLEGRHSSIKRGRGGDWEDWSGGHGVEVHDMKGSEHMNAAIYRPQLRLWTSGGSVRLRQARFFCPLDMLKAVVENMESVGCKRPLELSRLMASAACDGVDSVARRRRRVDH
jgi:hypothetical protein